MSLSCKKFKVYFYATDTVPWSLIKEAFDLSTAIFPTETVTGNNLSNQLEIFFLMKKLQSYLLKVTVRLMRS